MQEVPGSRWTIRYGCPCSDVPPALLRELRTQLRVIADELASLAEDSGVWQIVRPAELHIQVKGWRFAYRIPRRGILAVVGAHPILASEGPSRHPKRHLHRSGVESVLVPMEAPVTRRRDCGAVGNGGPQVRLSWRGCTGSG